MDLAPEALTGLTRPVGAFDLTGPTVLVTGAAASLEGGILMPL